MVTNWFFFLIWFVALIVVITALVITFTSSPDNHKAFMEVFMLLVADAFLIGWLRYHHDKIDD